MARILITGSADGLGQLAAKALIEQGHEVVLHARNAERRYTRQQTAGAMHATQAICPTSIKRKTWPTKLMCWGHSMR